MKASSSMLTDFLYVFSLNNLCSFLFLFFLFVDFHTESPQVKFAELLKLSLKVLVRLSYVYVEKYIGENENKFYKHLSSNV